MGRLYVCERKLDSECIASVIFCDYWCVVFSMGNLISIENLNDPHDQTILRGHDMQVSESSVL